MVAVKLAPGRTIAGGERVDDLNRLRCPACGVPATSSVRLDDRTLFVCVFCEIEVTLRERVEVMV